MHAEHMMHFESTFITGSKISAKCCLANCTRMCSSRCAGTKSHFLNMLYASPPWFCIQLDFYAWYTKKFVLTQPLDLNAQNSEILADLHRAQEGNYLFCARSWSGTVHTNMKFIMTMEHNITVGLLSSDRRNASHFSWTSWPDQVSNLLCHNDDCQTVLPLSL